MSHNETVRSKSGPGKIILTILIVLLACLFLITAKARTYVDNVIAKKLSMTITAESSAAKGTFNQHAFDLAVLGLGIANNQKIHIRDLPIAAPAIRSLLLKIGYTYFEPDEMKLQELKASSVKSLESLSGQKLGPDPEKWRKWCSSREKQETIDSKSIQK
ncbi:MAG: hypothetical protein CVV64_10240 [Candidatus Wallbacteria bacterium HGW-Wallbacteria-1]|jgi:hypothetical protein|uniref:Uncharacterized protein n=1 Tax=Candidatus Wallbacteria bacterium HGW-Wallbacteria-1 TaxID=2013854 RepID=A0A2N1PPS0_9BACT|nr:MAG: hypothetical protein CVV64_10240 [Candidatus Wallbacteria bacterium HGW-Wallbacteria-1]